MAVSTLIMASTTTSSRSVKARASMPLLGVRPEFSKSNFIAASFQCLHSVLRLHPLYRRLWTKYQKSTDYGGQDSYTGKAVPRDPCAGFECKVHAIYFPRQPELPS